VQIAGEEISEYRMRGRCQPLCRRYRPQHHSTIHRGELRDMKGMMQHRDCISSKEGAVESVASGSWPRFTTPPRRGWKSMHWSGVIETTREREKKPQVRLVNVGGARRSRYLRVCVCVCVYFLGHKATCMFEPVFSVFLIT
jgi:hypothetical protein